MSEEMNLYKRCKNIFKTHGVDIGGSGGGSRYKQVTFQATSSAGGQYDISDYPDLIAAIMNFNSTLYAGASRATQLGRIMCPDIDNRVDFYYFNAVELAMNYYPDEHMLHMSMPTGTHLTIWYEGTNE